MGALISKDATMASAHITVQEHIGHLTRHNPIGCDQKQFMCSYLVEASILHFIVVPLQRRVLVRCLYHYSQERGLQVLSCSSSHQWGKTVKFIYLIKGPGAYELPDSANFLTSLSDGDVSR